ncbi:MAG: hypothetical protein JXQ97_02385 [Natronospirillum sp.]
MRPGNRRKLDKDSSDEKIEHIKAGTRAKVEHPLRIFKCVFNYAKVRYRGLAKNTCRLLFMAGLVNLLRMKKACWRKATAPENRQFGYKLAKLVKKKGRFWHFRVTLFF